jgi:subtilisin family serine protease
MHPLASYLKRAGYSPMVANMGLGISEMKGVEKDATDYAIANDVIVAAAGNEGEAGIPGACAPIVSVGSIGWTGDWLCPTNGPRYCMWRFQDGSSALAPPLAGCRDRRFATTRSR